MYTLNDDSIVEYCIDEITSISDADMERIARFCEIGEARYMKFHDFVQALRDIREHHITDGVDLLGVYVFLDMIKNDIDDLDYAKVSDRC